MVDLRRIKVSLTSLQITLDFMVGKLTCNLAYRYRYTYLLDLLLSASKV